MNIKLIAILLSLPLFLFAQENDSEEEVPIPIEEQRNNKIKALLDVVKENKSIYVQKDQVRVKNFLDLVDERESMLAKAKQDLANEKLRNERLEARFEANEKQLAELEESLQIKIGVLGELFVKGHETSVNELLKENGHAYEYHGGKKKVFGG